MARFGLLQIRLRFIMLARQQQGAPAQKRKLDRQLTIRLTAGLIERFERGRGITRPRRGFCWRYSGCHIDGTSS